jgi:hypothetical protein
MTCKQLHRFSLARFRHGKQKAGGDRAAISKAIKEFQQNEKEKKVKQSPGQGPVIRRERGARKSDGQADCQ